MRPCSFIKSLMLIVGLLMALSLGSCDTVRSDELETKISRLETRVKNLEFQIEVRDSQIKELEEKLDQQDRRIAAFTTIITQHEDDFYYVYANLGWSGKELFRNFSLWDGSLWEAAWGCSGPCGWSEVMRNYDK